MSKKTIVIAGAGISGLTTALALAKNGIRTIVLERNKKIQEFGAGLQIGPNAHRALNLLGLEKALKPVSFEPEGVDIYSFAHDKPLITLKLGKTAHERFSVPYTVMHRADLVQTLYKIALQTELIDVIFDVQDFEIANIKQGVNVKYRLANRDSDNISCFAFIGADGVGSITRTKYLNGVQAKYSGYVAWRAMIDIEQLQNILNLQNTSLMWGPGFHAVAYPLAHRKLANIALFTKETMSVGFGIREKPNYPTCIMNDKRLSKICSLTNNWTHWPLAAVKTDIWFKDSVGLVGDAAHAMLPFQAQGAAMGIEDAVILAPLLANEESAATAFEIYVNKRRDRVNRVIKTSQNNARIFHMHKPFSLVRNIVVRAQGSMNHFSRLAWIYDFDPTI